MKNVEKITKKLYSSEVLREWKRLDKDAFHKMEFDTSMRFIKKYLPKKGLILDAGGGPGRYTIALAKLGYDVVLFDLTPELLDFAKKKIKKSRVAGKVKDIVNGSVADLSAFPDNKFDAVICLSGPISHIFGERQRRKAINELVRVSKKNAPIFISVFGKFGCLYKAPKFWPSEISIKNHFRNLAYKGEDHRWHHSSYAHFFTLEELKNLVSKNKKIKILETVGLEGLSSPYEDIMDKLKKKKKAWKNWMEVHYKLCTHPTVVDMSLHIMIIIRKIKI